VVRALIDTTKYSLRDTIETAAEELHVDPDGFSLNDAYRYMESCGMPTRQTMILPPYEFYEMEKFATQMLGAYLCLLPILTDWPMQALGESGVWNWNGFFGAARAVNMNFDTLLGLSRNIVAAMAKRGRLEFHARGCIFDFFVDPNALIPKYPRKWGMNVFYDARSSKLVLSAPGERVMKTCCTMVTNAGMLNLNIHKCVEAYEQVCGPITVSKPLLMPCMGAEVPIDTVRMCKEGSLYMADDWPVFSNETFAIDFVTTMNRTLVNKLTLR
jgi:hypothetical protein